MRITAEIELNEISYERDIHSLMAYLKAYLEENFHVPVDVVIDDLDYVDRVSLFSQLKGEKDTGG